MKYLLLQKIKEMTTAAIQKKIYQAIKTIDDIHFLNNIHQLVYDKAARGTIDISNDEWEKGKSRSR
jgi:hypothetical protein